jgi:ABC-2 type transport system ATP-binding protein
VLALLGPNGAGKTTTIRVLLGLRRPDEGRAILFGHDPGDPRARAHVGATPQETAFPEMLSVGELVDFARAHYARARPRAELLGEFGLGRLEERQAGGLSGGERRRLAVALAFAGNPEAVLLDEPTTGLDVDSRRGVWGAVRAFAAGGGTVLLTTHYLDEAEALADRVAVMVAGRIAADGAAPEIRRRAGLRRVRLGDVAVPDLAAAEDTTREPGRVTMHTRDVEALIRELLVAGVPLGEIEIGPVSLEDAFLALTREVTP